MNPLLVSLLLVGWSVAAAHGQGTVNFLNLYPNLVNPIVNAPFYESDGVTKCSGTQFMAELLAGPSANNLASIATTGFMTGNGAGYFNGGVQTINSVGPNGLAWVQIDVWNTASGSSFAQAQASGLANSWWQSSVFQVQTGSGSINPSLPGPLIGLGTSPVYLNSVPEPSSLALVGIGMGALLLIRCRKP